MLARPWKTVVRQGGAAEVAAMLSREIEALASEDDGLGAVVIGLPRRLNGDPNDQTRAVQAVAERLRPLLGIPLTMQDERLTSREAETLLAQREKDWRKRKPMLDATAAAIILQDYLDSRSVPNPEREAL